MIASTRCRLGLALLLAAGLIGCTAGCPTGSTTSNPRVTGNGPPPPKPLCDGWPQPAAALVLTGEQFGYLEPCGCTARQMGGLSRRADLVRQLSGEDRNWPLAALDLGGALNPDRVGRLQETMKFETTREALRSMDYRGMGWGAEELRMGGEALFGVFSAEQGAETTAPEFISANVTLFGERSVGSPLAFQILEVGGVRIGVTAVVGRTVWRRIYPEGVDPLQFGFGYVDPAAGLTETLPLMEEKQPDVMVLLAHCELNESRSLAEEFTAFDIVVTAGGYEDGSREPEVIGETWLLQVGQKGKHAGVVGIYPDDPSERFRFELVDLDRDRFANSPAIHEIMEGYVERLNSQRPDLTERELEHPRGAEFVGAKDCGECHTKAFAIWSQSRHSHAYESLTTGRKDETDYIVRTLDAECLCCHTTGWNPQEALRYASGFVDADQSLHLAGQQCENCHGPGSRHSELERAWRDGGGETTEELIAARREMHLNKDEAKTNLCIKCHDHDNSPTFDTPEKPFDTYWWPKVEHRGKD